MAFDDFSFFAFFFGVAFFDFESLDDDDDDDEGLGRDFGLELLAGSTSIPASLMMRSAARAASSLGLLPLLAAICTWDRYP